MNKTDGDPAKKGGAYAPKGVKHPAGPKLLARRWRPIGGWASSLIKTERHGHYGSIARARREKARAKAAA